MAQSINEQIGTLPAVEAKLHFFQVGLKMLCADLVPRPYDSTLKQRECGFNRVCRNREVILNPNIFFGSVIDGFMFVSPDCLLICGEIVGHDHLNIIADVSLNVLLEGSSFRIFSVKESQFPIALTYTDDNFFFVLITLAPRASCGNYGWLTARSIYSCYADGQSLRLFSRPYAPPSLEIARSPGDQLPLPASHDWQPSSSKQSSWAVNIGTAPPLPRQPRKIKT